MAENRGVSLGLGTSTIRPVTPARLTAPRQTALPQIRSGGVKVPKLTPPKISAPKKKDDGFSFGDIIGSIGSAAGYVGDVIKGVPTLAGKLGQTALGLGEFALDTVLDVPTMFGAPEFYRSRFEQDWTKAGELGLSGLEKLKFASQRQYPIFAPIAESGIRTGGNLAEVATVGLVDLGEPGFNYWEALKKGELGKEVLNDLGNVVMLSRAAGAGSVTAKAGTKLAAAGKPRLGTAVAGVGRFADEPIGASVRGVAAGLSRGAEVGGLAKTSAALSRIAAAVPGENVTVAEAIRAGREGRPLPVPEAAGVGPLRQAVTEVRNVRTIKAIGNWENIQKQINSKTAELDSLPANDPRRLKIEDDIETLKRDQKSALESSRLPKNIRDGITRMQTDAESLRTVTQTEIARIRRSGFVQETPEALRARAERIRDNARQVEASGAADEGARLNEVADFYERSAGVVERNPGVLNAPPPTWVSPATVILLTERIRKVIEGLKEGRSYADMADVLTSPEVTPDLELKGYRFTPEDVEAAYKSATGQMDEAGQLMIDQLSLLYTSWYKFFNESLQRGAGGREPLPFTYFQETPDPKFLVREIAKYGKQGARLNETLNSIVVELLSAIRPDVLANLKINPKKPKNAFLKLASQDYDSPEFRLANLILTQLYDDLLTEFPDVLRDPMIYSARMRPMIEADNNLLRLARSEDIDQMLVNMLNIAAEFPQFVDNRTIQSIVDKINALIDGPERFNKNVWRNVRNQVVDLQNRFKRQSEETQAAIERGELRVEESRQAIDDLFAAQERLGAVEATLATISNNPELFVGINRELRKAAELAGERTAKLKRKAVLETLLDSPIAKQELENIARELDASEEVIQRLQTRGEAEQVKEVRRGLKGVAVVGRANLPSGEKAPPRATLRAATRKEAEAEMARLRKTGGELEERQQVVADLRERHAQLDEASAQAQEVLAETPVTQELARPFGPQLLTEGQQPIYLPGGPTRQALGGFGPPTELRAEGMATATKGSYERMRETTLAPLSLTEVGQRLAEVLGALSRNEVVEAVITNRDFAKSTVGLLGQPLIDQLREQARINVEKQSRGMQGTTGLIRDQAAIDRATAKEFGVLLGREIDRRGYEPVSAVRINPDGTHEALGDVLKTVDPAAIDENTYLMRRGLKEKIAQQFVYQESSAIPPRVRQTFQKIGRLTSGWKSMILPFSLRWQVGDAVSNVLMAWVRGEIPPRELAAQMNNVVGRLRSQQTNLLNSVESSISDPLLNTLIGAGLQSRGLRLGDIAALRSGVATTEIGEFRLRGPFQGFREKMFRLNEFQNTVARLSVSMSKLGDILDGTGRTIDEINPASYLADPVLRDAVNQAVRETNDALGAFSQLTPFEKNTVRQIYPFWSWLKFINKAAAQLTIDNPERVLLMAHLGALVLDDEDQYGMFDFLSGTTPVSGMLLDLSFLNPYQDALLFAPNIPKAALDQLTSVSPVLTFPAKAAGAVGYYLTGRQGIPFADLSRPSYLEGPLGDTTFRTPGTTLGEIGYMGLQSFGGPFRNVLSMIPAERIPVIAPEGRLIGTDVAIGNVQRFPQGSARTSGVYAQPRLGPVAGPVSSLLRTFGVPAPIAEVRKVEKQAAQQKRREAQAARRRLRAYKESRSD